MRLGEWKHGVDLGFVAEHCRYRSEARSPIADRSHVGNLHCQQDWSVAKGRTCLNICIGVVYFDAAIARRQKLYDLLTLI